MAKIKNKTSHQSKRAISPVMIIVVVAVALLIVGGLIVFSNQTQSVDLSPFPSKGDANAPVTIVEYSDYGCSHCRDFVLEKSDLLQKEYIDTGQVKYVVHHYYLGNPAMGLATEAAWCTQDQGKFFEYQHALFENQGMTINLETLVNVAKGVGLDTDALTQCLSNGTHQKDVEQAAQAAASRGVNSTPTFFINNQRVRGNIPYDQFKRIIEQELAANQ